jgi:uncharacterized lipoprotein YmbA
LLALPICLGVTGCLSALKPVKVTERSFVLTSLPGTEQAAQTSGGLTVGVGQVKLPSYLLNSSLAIRRGTNEIDYSASAVWAERLDAGIQRTLAANLATLLHTDGIRLSAWQSEDVLAEVYVAIDQFDVDSDGRAALIARWRIRSLGGAKTVKSGASRFERHGPPPDTAPTGAVDSLSGLLGEFSQELAQELSKTDRRALP